VSAKIGLHFRWGLCLKFVSRPLLERWPLQKEPKFKISNSQRPSEQDSWVSPEKPSGTAGVGNGGCWTTENGNGRHNSDFGDITERLLDKPGSQYSSESNDRSYPHIVIPSSPHDVNWRGITYLPQLEAARHHPQSVVRRRGKKQLLLSVSLQITDPKCEIFVHKSDIKVWEFDSTRRMQTNNPRTSHLPWNSLTKNTWRRCLWNQSIPYCDSSSDDKVHACHPVSELSAGDSRVSVVGSSAGVVHASD